MGDKNCCPRSWDIGHKLGAVSIFLKYEGEGGHKADYCTHLDTRQLLGPGGMQALQARGNEGVLAMSGYSTLALDNGGDGSTGQSSELSAALETSGHLLPEPDESGQRWPGYNVWGGGATGLN